MAGSMFRNCVSMMSVDFSLLFVLLGGAVEVERSGCIVRGRNVLFRQSMPTHIILYCTKTYHQEKRHAIESCFQNSVNIFATNSLTPRDYDAPMKACFQERIPLLPKIHPYASSELRFSRERAHRLVCFEKIMCVDRIPLSTCNAKFSKFAK